MVFAQNVNDMANPSRIDYVNPLMGTASNFSLSNGNTYSVIAMPSGMNFWTPQTAPMGDGWMYSYTVTHIQWFKQTHQPSPWIGDYGRFSLFPMTGELKISGKSRASWFSHKTETAKPYYYSVYLADYDVTTEITPTERAAMFRFTFPENEKSWVLIDAFDKGSYEKSFHLKTKLLDIQPKTAAAFRRISRTILSFGSIKHLSKVRSGAIPL